MRGLSLWMCSQVRPMRSSAPGAKFSTSTSQCLISALEDLLALGMLGVDRDRALVVVEHREIEAVRALHVAQLAARDVADARPLDLDHVGAEPGEQLRAGRARLHMGEVEDAHAVERLAGLAEGLGRRPRQAVAAALLRGRLLRLRASRPSSRPPCDLAFAFGLFASCHSSYRSELRLSCPRRRASSYSMTCLRFTWISAFAVTT